MKTCLIVIDLQEFFRRRLGASVLSERFATLCTVEQALQRVEAAV